MCVVYDWSNELAGYDQWIFGGKRHATIYIASSAHCSRRVCERVRGCVCFMRHVREKKL